METVLLEEILSEVLDPATGWTLRTSLIYDNSALPFWRRVLSTIHLGRKYNGFRWTVRAIWQELRIAPCPGVEVQVYYAPDGGYIGRPDSGLVRLLIERQIQPELSPVAERTCSIGFSGADQKWYGWSHRALFGFGVGDFVDSEDHCCSQLSVGYQAKTLDDAKLMAIAFASSVG